MNLPPGRAHPADLVARLTLLAGLLMAVLSFGVVLVGEAILISGADIDAWADWVNTNLFTGFEPRRSRRGSFLTRRILVDPSNGVTFVWTLAGAVRFYTLSLAVTLTPLASGLLRRWRHGSAPPENPTPPSPPAPPPRGRPIDRMRRGRPPQRGNGQ